MKRTINEITNKIFKGFLHSIEKNGGLCPVKGLRYDGMRIPDYNDLMVQQLYLLRYFPAYLVEYFDIYRDVLKNKKFQKPFRVLSVGCGCGLDYYALELALKEKGTTCADTVYYTGVDKIQWAYSDDLGNDDFEILICDFIGIGDINSIQDKAFDIIIFPKSIGEFSERDFKALIKQFKSSTFPKDEIYIISSIRKEYTSIDQDRMEKLLTCLEDIHGYYCEKPRTQYIYYKKSAGIRKHFYDFVYPDEIFKFLNNLDSKCPTKLRNGKFCESDCQQNLNNKRPILKTDHIRYQYFKLKK